jgi:hypothetical protein
MERLAPADTGADQVRRLTRPQASQAAVAETR